MLNCWEGNAESRPTFTQLVLGISTILEGLADYLDFNTFSLPKLSLADSKELDTYKKV